MSNFVISCGGTGGHLAPGIALAEELQKRGHKCSLVISKKDVDSRLVENYKDMDFAKAPGLPFSANPIRFLKFVVSQLKSITFAFCYLREKRPDVIIAFGGFITAGIAIAGFFLGIPIALHEANRQPGRAIRSLRGLADRIYLPEGTRIVGVPAKILRYPGYPVRKSIERKSKEEAREILGIKVTGKLLVIIGGSQGAASLNEWVKSHFDDLAAEGISVYCVTGLGKASQGTFESRSPNGELSKIYFVPFTDKMGVVLSAADLVISRAGAGSIAELIRCQIPSILVPYKFAADNHQLANARFLEQQGGSIVVEEDRLKDLFKEVRDTIFNDWLLAKFRENLERLNRKDSAALIANDLEELCQQTQQSGNAEIDMPA